MKRAHRAVAWVNAVLPGNSMLSSKGMRLSQGQPLIKSRLGHIDSESCDHLSALDVEVETRPLA